MENGQGSSLGALDEVVIQHGHLTVVDSAGLIMLRGDVGDLDLRRGEGGAITGAADGRFTLGETVLSVRMTAAVAPDGGTHADLSLLPLATKPIDMAALSPALAKLGVLDTTVELQASLDLSPALRPERATLRATAGPGSLSVPNSTPVAFDRVAMTASAQWPGSGWQGDAWRPVSVKIDPAEFVLVSAAGRRTTARITADALAAENDARWTVRTTLAVDHAELADLSSLWPYAWGGFVRPWLTDNAVAGLAHDAALTATIDLPENDPTQAKVTAAGGTMQADNLVVYWLRPVPPVEHAQAVLTVTGPDALVIAVSKAQQGPIVLTDGRCNSPGYRTRISISRSRQSVQGGVPDLLKVLREKGLHLLSDHPLPITGSAGKAVARLAVNVPMFEHLRFDQVTIASKGRLSGLRLDGLVAGRPISDGDIGFDVTQDGLNASGTASVDGLPGQVEVGMNFRSGGPTEIVQRARFVGRIGTAALAAHGIDASSVMTGGTGSVDASYREQRNGVAAVSARADLTGAGLAIAGWHKAPGVAAQAAAALTLNHGAVTDVPQLTASGPGLDIAAQGRWRTAR